MLIDEGIVHCFEDPEEWPIPTRMMMDSEDDTVRHIEYAVAIGPVVLDERKIIKNQRFHHDMKPTDMRSDHKCISWCVGWDTKVRKYKMPKRKRLDNKTEVTDHWWEEDWADHRVVFERYLGNGNMEMAWTILLGVAEQCMLTSKLGIARSELGTLKHILSLQLPRGVTSREPQIVTKLRAVHRKIRQAEREPWNNELKDIVTSILEDLSDGLPDLRNVPLEHARTVVEDQVTK